MQQTPPSISPGDLHAGLGTASAPIVVDVRRPADFAKAGELIVSAFHRPPDDVERWQKDLPSGRRWSALRAWARSPGVAAALARQASTQSTCRTALRVDCKGLQHTGR